MNFAAERPWISERETRCLFPIERMNLLDGSALICWCRCIILLILTENKFIFYHGDRYPTDISYYLFCGLSPHLPPVLPLSLLKSSTLHYSFVATDTLLVSTTFLCYPYFTDISGVLTASYHQPSGLLIFGASFSRQLSDDECYLLIWCRISLYQLKLTRIPRQYSRASLEFLHPCIFFTEWRNCLWQTSYNSISLL